MKLKDIWAMCSLTCGASAIIILIGKLLVAGYLYEPSLIIKIGEIIWGLTSVAYFIQKLWRYSFSL